ncbi:hypothetical protein BDW02DRAFT_199974 [Decorospora gaudefroyi]|uniref:Uncharacterized protein n=1 Tax=Decorospora gaudefroyi TaxID=184978 RepID=A0A6A5K3M7_9PLEO|nr:hypothetical protein BDW02DRAFT_199974 [Decorospora gaudefroyi]
MTKKWPKPNQSFISLMSSCHPHNKGNKTTRRAKKSLGTPQGRTSINPSRSPLAECRTSRRSPQQAHKQHP